MQSAVRDEDAAPDDLTRLAHSLERTAPRSEVHRRLALADRSGITIHEMRGRRCAGYLEDPHETVGLVGVEMPPPADVVQGGGGIEAQRRPDPVGNQRVDCRAFIYLVEVRQCLT